MAGLQPEQQVRRRDRVFGRHKILTPPGGVASPERDRLREALAGVDRPDLMLDWLNKPGVRRTLQAVATHRAITHEALDTLPPGRTLDHVRSMLVAAGAPGA